MNSRDKLDQSLFRSAKYNPDHVLHRHLPPRKQTGYNLRDKSHNLTLPQSVNATLKQNFVPTLRIGYVQFFVRTDHYTLVLSP